MARIAEPLTRLVNELLKLPGIGERSAYRLAFHLLQAPKGETDSLVRAITDLKEKTLFCSICHNLTDRDPCTFCTDLSRDHERICVVEHPANVITIERSGAYKGLYHVLHGAISPIHGIGPDRLKIGSLLQRLKEGGVKEIILATNPDVEGEMTANHLAKLLKDLDVRVTRIALGLPVGSDLEFADDVTLSKALEGRREL